MSAMEGIKLIHTAETDSTNRLLRDYAGEEGRLLTVLTADYQTAGRGQGRNTWESEPGKNLLASIRLHPRGLAAARQYALTEAGALAVRDTVAAYVGGASVKWPNDVYAGDRKISGTLSECDISGTAIKTCTLGIGLNVNQRVFRSGAPNPVSIAQPKASSSTKTPGGGSWPRPKPWSRGGCSCCGGRTDGCRNTN